MITPAEREILDEVYEAEQDFYAPLLVLALCRVHINTLHSIHPEDAKRAVLSAYKDIKEGGL